LDSFADFGFDSYCGTSVKIRNDTLSGEIESYCTERDKLQFFINICQNLNISKSDTIAIGDSKSDHPIFRDAGKSVALNADIETRKLATYSINTQNLLDILPFFE
jgi:phosphoserine phosphatase